MAKQAKAKVEIEASDKDIKNYVADILERYANIESARGSFMLAARREREGMESIYELMAAKGIPQKVSKTEIAIIRLIGKIKKLMLDLERDQRKMVEKLAKAQGDRRQLSLLLDVPARPKPMKKTKAEPMADNVVPLSQAEPEAQGAA